MTSLFQIDLFAMILKGILIGIMRQWVPWAFFAYNAH